MIELPQHSLRRPLTDELHARPFTPMEPPTQVVYLALMPDAEAERRTPTENLAHLNALLAHLGAAPAMADGPRVPNFYLGAFDGFRLKWERHSEFTSFMITLDEPGPKLLQPHIEHLISPGWIEEAGLRVISASVLDAVAAEDEAEAERIAIEDLAPQFHSDSLALTWVTDRSAVTMGDFRIDENGFSRFAVITLEGRIGHRRLGRIVQRLIEMETYRVLAMKALPLSRRLGPSLTEIEGELAETTRRIAEAEGHGDPETDRITLSSLTALSADLEKIAAESAYRFGAARAYETIVYDRIDALREERLQSRQTYAEFMVRRFKPALRTIHSASDRLSALSARTERAANLLRTRIDVSLEAQNQELLKSMNERGHLQLRLQQTVEGLSVVAISYYAVSLAGYLLGPLFSLAGAGGEKTAMAVVALPIIGLVYWMVRNIRKKLDP